MGSEYNPKIQFAAIRPSSYNRYETESSEKQTIIVNYWAIAHLATMQSIYFKTDFLENLKNEQSKED